MDKAMLMVAMGVSELVREHRQELVFALAFELRFSPSGVALLASQHLIRHLDVEGHHTVDHAAAFRIAR